ncbi:MAG: ABC transporter permease subunit [Mariprofundales bacterium]
MKHIWTIAWHEWRTTVDTPLGYVVAVAFLLSSGFVFGDKFFLGGPAEMRAFLMWLPLLWMFFLPALGMRLIAEEMRIGTFELLATLPIDAIHIVLGKYLGLLLQITILLACTLVYPISLMLLGNPDTGQLLVAYLAALLLGAAYASICLFASSLTDNAVVAYVIGFAMLLGMFLVGQAILPIAVQQWVDILSPAHHYGEMLRGVIGLNNVVFFMGMSAVFVALATYQLERRRWL